MLNVITGVLDAPTPPVTNSYESIATVTAAGGESSLTFSSIPATYKHLQIRGIGRDNNASTYTTGMYIQFNSDTGSNYSWHRLYGESGSAAAGAATSQTSILAGVLAGNQYTTSAFGAAVVDVLDYANTSKYKTLRGLAGIETNVNPYGYIGLDSGLWMSTSAITSIAIKPAAGQTWLQYSTFALYGIKG